MDGEKDLGKLLKSMSPRLLNGDFVFCTAQDAKYGDFTELVPLASFLEQEGLTIVVTKENADRAGLGYGPLWRCIMLTVHSSLDAVGFTAAVAGKLADRGISANVIAAYYHDYVFVQVDQAEIALSALNEFGH